MSPHACDSNSQRYAEEDTIKTSMADDEEGDLWLFGYGSLIWKPPPDYERQMDLFYPFKIFVFPATLKAMCAVFGRRGRRTFTTPMYFCEETEERGSPSSEDHRGTPEAPGRVCTLIDRKLWETLTDQHTSAPPKVWGAAYRIPAPKVPQVKEYMNIREINGYSIQYAPFQQQPSKKEDMSATYQQVHMPDGQAIKCLVYIGLPDNPQFLGVQDPQALAEHIVKSRGPSGENKDYLYQLEEALDALSAESGDEHISDLARRCREIEAREAKS
ncbi:Glutathione-specific gamma-glutamylcyclotransferase [Lecanosticta acicola]|uniref:glutathione-specific gamma-glutamylcyclotransferase n=1 Tax=Lecanosticta acicola TaxID=111012 RepID=A0AAI9ECW9_9PEZI|nr:Glutathione-specific gamma-glutamylcyclotransferase [Lecanosticta acicola]